ncbi:peptidoglycan-binding domain-containing protein [Pseudoprimorskyibacter insulae]|uniref:Peptidoglycan binding-like domain-containing protein n=1 Tax=Pseudoprimorskyibacter insulae TaxID=1695997 RepID=A0A2R8B155_9RHOB|nr:hypothetical protein [Pseudoprimorskyibacter insulae]SPF81839.1 hypothetical protein PRI8871_03664 [Pseudoprimorskyibacter insulae]
MKRAAAFLSCAFAGLVGPAWATPCVTESFDEPLPGSQGMAYNQADVPTALFPAFWQTGWVNGFYYELYPNGYALLASGQSQAAWKIEVICNFEDRVCSTTEDGFLPKDAPDTAAMLGACLLGDKIAEAAPAKPVYKPFSMPVNLDPSRSFDREDPPPTAAEAASAEDATEGDPEKATDEAEENTAESESPPADSPDLDALKKAVSTIPMTPDAGLRAGVKANLPRTIVHGALPDYPQGESGKTTVTATQLPMMPAKAPGAETTMAELDAMLHLNDDEIEVGNGLIIDIDQRANTARAMALPAEDVLEAQKQLATAKADTTMAADGVIADIDRQANSARALAQHPPKSTLGFEDDWVSGEETRKIAQLKAPEAGHLIVDIVKPYKPAPEPVAQAQPAPAKPAASVTSVAPLARPAATVATALAAPQFITTAPQAVAPATVVIQPSTAPLARPAATVVTAPAAPQLVTAAPAQAVVVKPSQTDARPPYRAAEQSPWPPGPVIRLSDLLLALENRPAPKASAKVVATDPSPAVQIAQSAPQQPLRLVAPAQDRVFVLRNDTVPQPRVKRALCGLAAQPEGPDVLTLQRLLVAAGENPGVLDGILGRRTVLAYRKIWTDQRGRLDVKDAIQKLDAYLCATQTTEPGPVRPTASNVQTVRIVPAPQTTRTASVAQIEAPSSTANLRDAAPVTQTIMVQPAQPVVALPARADEGECVMTVNIQRGQHQIYTMTQTVACPEQ